MSDAHKSDLLLVVVTLFAAFGWMFSKEALNGFPPLLFIGVRFLFAGLLLVSACSVAFLLPVAFGAINQWLGIRTAVFMLLFGLLGLCLLMFAVGTRHRVYQYLS